MKLKNIYITKKREKKYKGEGVREGDELVLEQCGVADSESQTEWTTLPLLSFFPFSTPHHNFFFSFFFHTHKFFIFVFVFNGINLF